MASQFSFPAKTSISTASLLTEAHCECPRHMASMAEASRSCVQDDLFFISLTGPDPSFAECQAWPASLASTHKLGCRHHIAFLLLSGDIFCMAPSSGRGAELHHPRILKAPRGWCWSPRQQLCSGLARRCAQEGALRS